MERYKLLKTTAASTPQIQSTLNFPLNLIFIYYYRPQTFELCHSFEGLMAKSS